MAPKIIYVTGFRQHAGKTVACLGLLHLLKAFYKPEELGYIKPVGQELVELEDGTKVDKDAIIMRQFAGIPDFDMKNVSPVRLGSGFTKDYIDSADRRAMTKKLKMQILQALSAYQHKKVIVAEGTGHPGVGGIVGLSNAFVGNLMKADILFLSGGGIGKALDMLEVDLSYFLYKRSRVRGILFNKVFPSKLSTVKDYISEELINEKYGKFGRPLKILGYLPEVSELNKPSMSIILSKFRNSRPIGDVETPAWRLPCSGIKVLSLAAEFFQPEQHLNPGDIVLLGSASRSRRIKLLSYQRALQQNQYLGGIILTCGKTTPLDPEIEKQIAASGIPAVYVQEDTAAAEAVVSAAFESTKIQVYDTDKYEQIKELFSGYFDLESFRKTMAV